MHTGMYCSILPPGKTPCNLGPKRLSLSNVNITLSVIIAWKMQNIKFILKYQLKPKGYTSIACSP